MSSALHNSLLLFCSLKEIILDFTFENFLGKKRLQRCHQECLQAENYAEGLVSYFSSSGVWCVVITYRQAIVWEDCMDDLQQRLTSSFKTLLLKTNTLMDFCFQEL